MDSICGNSLGDLDRLYVETLQHGLYRVRDAIRAGEQAWAAALAEFLHNIPSLIGEPNAMRHRYFWEAERTAYMEWVAAHGSEEGKSHMRTYYEPIWEAMRPLIP